MTPHTQESYRKIDEEFDHLLRQNQLPQEPVQGHGIQVNSFGHLPPSPFPPSVNFHLRGSPNGSTPLVVDFHSLLSFDGVHTHTRVSADAPRQCSRLHSCGHARLCPSFEHQHGSSSDPPAPEGSAGDTEIVRKLSRSPLLCL